LKLTPAERKALQESINHWQEDVINKFVGGNTPSPHYDYWIKSKEELRHRSEYCPLCIHCGYTLIGFPNCEQCPYKVFYGFECDSAGGHWFRFEENRSKKYAIAMRDALQAILDSDKQNKLTIRFFKCGCVKIIEHRECSGYVADDDDIYGRCKFANQIQGNYAPKPFDCTNINLHQEYKIK